VDAPDQGVKNPIVHMDFNVQRGLDTGQRCSGRDHGQKVSAFTIACQDPETNAAAGDADLLLELGAAAVQGRTALGERVGERDVRVGRGSRSEPFVKRPLCADVDGFRPHAAVRVAAGGADRGAVGSGPGRRLDFRSAERPSTPHRYG
jgi:hypothetical protein